MTYDRSLLVMHPKPDDYVPEPTFPPGHRFEGSARCQAWSRRNGRQCLGFPLRGKKVCNKHGGSTPGGIAAPNWKHGRQSKYLPRRMQETYRAGLRDKELLALKEEILVVDSRITDLLKRVDIGEAGRLWLRSQEVLLQLRQAIISQDNRKVGIAITELDDLIRKGSTDYAAWDEVARMIDLRRRLVESERKRLVDMQQMITAEQAQVFFRALTLAIKENVTDNDTLKRIQTAFTRISNTPN